jgi:hypothetical protein
VLTLLFIIFDDVLERFLVYQTGSEDFGQSISSFLTQNSGKRSGTHDTNFDMTNLSRRTKGGNHLLPEIGTRANLSTEIEFLPIAATKRNGKAKCDYNRNSIVNL